MLRLYKLEGKTLRVLKGTCKRCIVALVLHHVWKIIFRNSKSAFEHTAKVIEQLKRWSELDY